MDAQAIFSYLIGEMEIVSFKDFLKRYIYERTGMDLPFKEVTDDVYRDIIMESFQENAAPHSFTSTAKRWSAIVKGWLTQNSVKRDTIFLLGFGLKISPQDVSEFLTKVIQEEDFRKNSPREVIFWYCFHNGYRYAKAVKLLSETEEEAQNQQGEVGGNTGTDLSAAGERETVHYAAALMRQADQNAGEQDLYEIVMDLLGQTKEIIADIYQADEDERGSKKQWTRADISSADIEKVISCGIPVTDSGNLQKASSSMLAKQFHLRRLTRQRLDGILSREYEPDRFDLITLLLSGPSSEEGD